MPYNKEELGRRIRELRKALGLNQGELGAKIGLKKSVVSDWEIGKRTPSMDTLQKLADILGISVGELIGAQDIGDAASFGERLVNCMVFFGDSTDDLAQFLGVDNNSIHRMCADDMDPTAEQLEAIAQRYDIDVQRLLGRTGIYSLPSNLRPLSDLHHQKVPLIGKVAAGQPILAETDYDTFVDAPIDCDCALEIEGDSMVPTYMPGDIIYIKHRQTVNDGQVAVVLIDDSATVKHIYRTPEGLTLISDNPAHPPIYVKGEEHDYIAIYGVPVGYTRMYKNHQS